MQSDRSAKSLTHSSMTLGLGIGVVFGILIVIAGFHVFGDGFSTQEPATGHPSGAAAGYASGGLRSLDLADTLAARAQSQSSSDASMHVVANESGVVRSRDTADTIAQHASELAPFDQTLGVENVLSGTVRSTDRADAIDALRAGSANETDESSGLRLPKTRH